MFSFSKLAGLHHFKLAKTLLTKANNQSFTNKIALREFTKKNGSKLVQNDFVKKEKELNKFLLFAKSFAFTAGFSGVCYSIATITQYERLKSRNINYPRKSGKFLELREELNELWNGFSGVKKCVIGIIFINSFVLLAGRILAKPVDNTNANLFRSILLKHFYLSPTSKNMSQMVLSTFNHGGVFHLGANMLALFSISGLLENFMAHEQFIAFYLSSGVFASFCSKTFNLFALRNTLSVGASGAVVSCFALASFMFPDTKFYIFPIPFPIEAQDMLRGLVGIDMAGLIMGFRVIDHAAHLGGALYAYLIWSLNKYGRSDYHKYQKALIQYWKKLNGNSKN